LDLIAGQEPSDITDENPCFVDPKLLEIKNPRSKKEQEYLNDIWSVQKVSYTFSKCS
jgi:hypothetical protein